MLYIDGTALRQSIDLYNAYVSFIKKDTYAYMLLDSSEEKLSLDDLSMCKTNIYIGTTQLCILDNEHIVVNHAGYRCSTSLNFLKVQINKIDLSNLTTFTFRCLNEALYQVARFRALYLNMLVLHASAVVYNDEVILFSGVKGAGKSTQARLWLENTDAWVLNYDKPVVKLDEERVLVSGSPWGGKEDLAINEVRPAKALFFVHQAKENRVVRLSSGMAYAEAHLNYFVYPLNEDIEKRYNDSIIQLIKKIPVYDLYCTDTAEAVFAVKRVLYPEEE